ncbi:MAG: hypothetical protein FWF43_05815 [Propionibacteriaceae bacterium]|nr:hypothetical protein [Propionibacteriaceae bacterium]
MNGPPNVLIIDDRDQAAVVADLSLAGVDARWIPPNDLTYESIEQADLILIDEFLEEWPCRDQLKNRPGLYVRDGLALAGVIRSHLENRGSAVTADQSPRRTAIALRTGHLNVLAAGVPAFMRAIAVARRHDLEWVVEKGLSTPTKALAEVAYGAASLPEEWNPQLPTTQMEWLGLRDQMWCDGALSQIEQCRPPWSMLAETSAGRHWLAWFLQDILPFPTFLVDDLRAAGYLGLHTEALELLLNGQSPLADRLRSCVYTGHLAGVAGRRWWRVGISDVRSFILESAPGRTANDIAHGAITLHGTPLPCLKVVAPVFEIDSSYNVVVDPVEVTDAVRLQPDGWPPYADDPWMRTESIDDEPELAKLIVMQDRYWSDDAADSE